MLLAAPTILPSALPEDAASALRAQRRSCVRPVALLGLLLTAGGSAAAEAGATPEPLSPASATVVEAEQAVVASRSPFASAVGAEVLEQGGNAVDAAVAMGFALAVTHPSAGNLGGGGFMVLRLANGELAASDHRETAPAKASRAMYQDEDGNVVAGLSTASHLAVGVPGTVAGLLDVLAKYGSWTRQAAISPALQLARAGFPLPADLAAQFESQRENFARYPASRAVFAKADGSAYQAGEVFRQPDLAATLARIAANGRDGFYRGETADLIVAEMERGGGLVSHEDLAGYRPRWRAPVRGSYRGFEVVSMPPPSSGGILLVQMLNMIERYDVGAMGFGSTAKTHLYIEAARRAYADRAEHLGDPDFYDVPAAMLTSKAYAARRLADFDPERASDSSEVGAGGPLPAESPETTHVSVLDAAGNAVAYTTTLNLGYGAKIVVAGGGFLLNNEMDDFSAKPNVPNAFGLVGGEANAIAPGKRMLSSMTPTILLKDGKPVLVTGSPGGSTIITTVLQVVLNVVDHGMALADAVASPRLHHQWLPNRVVYEPGAATPEALAELEERGHVNVQQIGFRIGDANSAMRVGAGLVGVSDPRNHGGAAGF